MYSGRTQREKDRLVETITEDVVEVLNVDKKEIVIVFQEASHGNWYVSGVRVGHTTLNSCYLIQQFIN